LTPYLHGVMGDTITSLIYDITQRRWRTSFNFGTIIQLQTQMGEISHRKHIWYIETNIHITFEKDKVACNYCIWCVQSMFVVSSIIWSLRRKRWMSLGAHVSYLDWSHVRGWVEHKWITTIWKTLFTLKAKSFRRNSTTTT
jgi:hypothetical protein